MPSDKLTFLEQLSNALAGQSATSGAKALGEGIGYGFSGGALSDIPDVMREAIEEHKQRTANQPKKTQDALEVVSGLAAMSNPYSAVGHAMDFVGAVPSMIQQKLSGEPLPTGQVMEGGLKRRLAKGGAAAEFAMANQLERAKANIQSKVTMPPNQHVMLPIWSKNAKWGPGEGKFQTIGDHATYGYDLSKEASTIGMNKEGLTRIIDARPHELGTEFTFTLPGLADRYRDKGYGKAFYQNMTDYYGGGISHAGSTTPPAREVYKSLDAIDTGLQSGGGTRKVIVPSDVKNNPEAYAAFEQKVRDYAESQRRPKQNSPLRNTQTQSSDLRENPNDLRRMRWNEDAQARQQQDYQLYVDELALNPDWRQKLLESDTNNILRQRTVHPEEMFNALFPEQRFPRTSGKRNSYDPNTADKTLPYDITIGDKRFVRNRIRPNERSQIYQRRYTEPQLREKEAILQNELTNRGLRPGGSITVPSLQDLSSDQIPDATSVERTLRRLNMEHDLRSNENIQPYGTESVITQGANRFGKELVVNEPKALELRDRLMDIQGSGSNMLANMLADEISRFYGKPINQMDLPNRIEIRGVVWVRSPQNPRIYIRQEFGP